VKGASSIMYLTCHKRKGSPTLHTDICVAANKGEGCKHLIREYVDLPQDQAVEYKCIFKSKSTKAMEKRK